MKIYIRDEYFKIPSSITGTTRLTLHLKKIKRTNYQDFCRKCIQGRNSFKPSLYIMAIIHKENTNIPKENIYVTIVSPTKAAVDQAESELTQENGINSNEKIHICKLEARLRSNR